MKITYLFGAGASKHALPIVNEIPERIKTVIALLKLNKHQLSDTEFYDEANSTSSKSEIQKILIDDLEWLLINSKNHASIDTYAKKLYLKENNKDLNRLKAAFSVYLIIEQIINPPDKRYDSFFASILKDSYHEFPANMRILSWNYDSQFEISYSEYSDQNSFYQNQAHLNLKTKLSHDNLNNSRFAILKLNGSTNLLSDQGFRKYEYIGESHQEFNKTNLDAILKSFAALRIGNNNLFSGLSFAWERFGKPENDIVLKAKNETLDTEVLVVIGYSFPYFNREIDREIIGNMNLLKKVYFQAPDANDLKERFLSIRNDINSNMLISRFDLEQFLLPNEL